MPRQVKVTRVARSCRRGVGSSAHRRAPAAPCQCGWLRRSSTRYKETIEPPRAKTFGLKRIAEPAGKLSRSAGSCLSRANWFGENAADLKASHHLIETAAEFWTKAPGERRAWFCRDLADALEAEG